MNWRPDRWESYYDIVSRGDIIPMDCDMAYEAGADAMLEALKNKNFVGKVENGEVTPITYDWNDKNGVLVFIPDDK